MSELKRFDIVGKYADEETVYDFRPDGECYDADEVDKVIRRNKYKRCLAISKLCRSEWAAAIFIPEKCMGEKHAVRYMRW